MISIGLGLLGAFAEDPPHAFAKLQLGFGPRGIAIGESLLAEVVDCGEDILKLADSASDLLDQNRFGPGPRVFCCVCSCHGCVKKVYLRVCNLARKQRVLTECGAEAVCRGAGTSNARY